MDEGVRGRTAVNRQPLYLDPSSRYLAPPLSVVNGNLCSRSRPIVFTRYMHFQCLFMPTHAFETGLCPDLAGKLL